MLKTRLTDKLTNEKGSGLVLALMVLLVLSVLGASLGVVTIGSLQLSDINRDSNSAYYIAEAGANLAYEDFEEIVNDTYDGDDGSEQDSFFIEVNKGIWGGDKLYGGEEEKNGVQFDSQFGDAPTAFVSIDPPSSTGIEREYTIKSVGNVDGKTRTVYKKVSVHWISKNQVVNFPTIPEYAAGIVQGGDKHVIKLRGISEVTGNLYVNNIENSVLKKMNKDYQGKNITSGYEVRATEVFEDFKQYTEDLEKHVVSISNSETNLNLNKKDNSQLSDEDDLSYDSDKDALNLLLNKDARIKTLNIDKGQNHKIDVGNNNIVLAMEKLTHKSGHTEIIGDGTLTIFVTEEVKFEDDGIFNLTNKNVRIVVSKKAKVVIVDNPKLNTQIVSPYSEVSIEGKEAVIKGTIIAKSLDIKNKNYLMYESFGFNDPIIGTEESATDRGDLITSEPAIESE